MLPLSRGRHVVRLARSPGDLLAAQRLRGACFRKVGVDADAFDALCRHLLVEDRDSGALVCCLRVLPLASGAGIERSYSAQFYDLSRLHDWPGPMAEVGRFCIRPGLADPDILRAAWAGLTAMVDSEGIGMLFGCSSFPGTDPAPHADALALLKERHLAPARWRPGIKAADVFPYACALDGVAPDPARAQAAMPPLLRSYLSMGGWVSDHAVIDAALGTFHVFTGLEIEAIPPARKRLLRALVAVG
ncbi:GNAT family N-acetyltransferase [Paracoccus sp. S-4012]|uniref:GNAT family N-acetyltransferase n=1 Tax=Paracoccus sp. S-4012 TaxID=2665648 RepID=UPI0012AEF93F|nr:GNAT family N-acetyltransferase [Paracoccus sp. S-4012]MRX50278.1 GNAT family N-acetyltransferase [Paracoccus sp. S-4012]